MLVTIVSVVLAVFAIYFAVGILFTIPFQVKGLRKIDEGAHGSSIGFRIIIIPGCIIFWPILLERWIEAERKAR
jgi:hypothetical protein